MILENILYQIKKFPKKLDKHLGELIKEQLSDITPERTVNKSAKTIMYKYRFKLDKISYLFVVEYIFKEYETFLDLKRAIGINYYLYKEEEDNG